jgi:hypothetical protein
MLASSFTTALLLTGILAESFMSPSPTPVGLPDGNANEYLVRKPDADRAKIVSAYLSPIV